MILVKNIQISEDTLIEIGKFSVLWNMLEKKFFNYNLGIAQIKEKIKTISFDCESVRKLKDAINDRKLALNVEKWKDYYDYHIEDENAHHLLEEYKSEIIDFIENNNNNTYGCLLFIYKIRNNLFHGLKDVYDLDNQVGLFRAINGVLEKIK